MIQPPFIFFLGVALLMGCGAAMAKTPKCDTPESWPGSMALTYLKNAGVIDADGHSFNLKNTTVQVIASGKIDKDLYRQVHLVRFFKQTGEELDAITVSNASSQECSMSDVEVYLVSKRYGNPPSNPIRPPR